MSGRLREGPAAPSASVLREDATQDELAAGARRFPAGRSSPWRRRTSECSGPPTAAVPVSRSCGIPGFSLGNLPISSRRAGIGMPALSEAEGRISESRCWSTAEVPNRLRGGSGRKRFAGGSPGARNARRPVTAGGAGAYTQGDVYAYGTHDKTRGPDCGCAPGSQGEDHA